MQNQNRPSIRSWLEFRDGTEYDLNQPKITFGKGNNNDLRCNTKADLAAVMQWNGKEWTLTPYSSYFLDGVKVNGKLVPKYQNIPLRDGDVIELAGAVCRFHSASVDDSEQELTADEYRDLLKQSIEQYQKTKEYHTFEQVVTILMLLEKASLFANIQIDPTKLFGGLNPEQLQPGQEFKLDQDVPVKIVEATLGDGTTVYPLCLTAVIANEHGSCMELAPRSYLQLIVKSNRPGVIDCGNNLYFFLPPDLAGIALKKVE